jgi:hypothetical protein
MRVTKVLPRSPRENETQYNRRLAVERVNSIMWSEHNVEFGRLTTLPKEVRADYMTAAVEAEMHNRSGVATLLSLLAGGPPPADITDTF